MDTMRYWVVCCDTFWRALQGDRESWVCPDCGAEARLASEPHVSNSQSHTHPSPERIAETADEMWISGRLSRNIHGFMSQVPS